MSVPEELVQAAAEAMHKANCEPCFHDEPSENYKRLAKAALAAAFAALPVDEIREQALAACASLRTHPDGANVFYREAEEVISEVWSAALARDFGEKG